MLIVRSLNILLLFGLAIRLVFLPLPGFKIDMDDWYAWAVRLSNFNFAQFYSKDVFTDYTPGYLYILSLLGYLKNLLGLQNNFYLLLKIPAIISDLIIGFLVYKELIKSVSRKWAVLALIFILFNPVLIFNSALWGQIDSVLALLMLIAVFALTKKSFIVSSIFFGLALLVKPQAIALIPLFAIFLENNFSWLNLLKMIIPGFLIIFILSFPFFPNQTLFNLILHITNTVEEYPYTSLNAYNFWGVVGFWVSDKAIWNGFTYQVWGYLMIIGCWVIIGYFYFRKRISIYALAVLATLMFFFLPTRVHERYLYPAIIFLIIYSSLYKSKLLFVLTGLLSFLNLLNLYYVYTYYNKIYFKMPTMIYNPVLYDFLESQSKSLSLISVGVFILISIVIIKNEIKS